MLIILVTMFLFYLYSVMCEFTQTEQINILTRKCFQIVFLFLFIFVNGKLKTSCYLRLVADLLENTMLLFFICCLFSQRSVNPA